MFIGHDLLYIWVRENWVSGLIGFICFQGDRMRYRRRRTAFTEEQLARLEESFLEEKKFPGITIGEQLAEELNLKEDRIQVIKLTID